MGLLKTLKYWLTPLKNDQSGFWIPNLYIRPKIRNSFLGSAHKKKEPVRSCSFCTQPIAVNVGNGEELRFRSSPPPLETQS
jgi:hypothetical protein